MVKCIHCEQSIAKGSTKYCSNKCQSDYNYAEYINKWHDGGTNGQRGINTKNLSGHIVRYISEKYSSKCAFCDWHEINKTTGNTPLEIDHIDGDSENNNENNLILLCPNCHSLTPNYKNLNRGSGRSWRREKYVKII